MGFRQIRTSDLSGGELKDDEVVTVAVKSHPDLTDGGRVFDAAQDELAGLKPVTNLVQLELRYADGTTKDVLVTKTDFSKVVPDEVLKNADSLRGRRTGYKPGSNGA
jgi:hypothetical protein